MKIKKFYPKDGRNGTFITSEDDIRRTLGELGKSINAIDICDNGLVIGYIDGQGITLGKLK